MRIGESELARLRGLPLEPLAERLGYRRDPADRARWKREGSVITISGARFFDHLAGTGGGGAIDLVVHARRCRFLEACAFLGASPGAGAAGPRLPGDCRAGWPRVRDRLAAARSLEPALLERCRALGILYADRRANAVFLCRDAAGEAAGAELVGTRPGRPFRRMAPGSAKAGGGFWIRGGDANPDTVLLAEGAIDALSAFALGLVPDGAATRLPPWIEAWRPKRILCGHDADEAGDAAARVLQAGDPRARRLRPEGGKDWNEILQRRAAAP